MLDGGLPPGTGRFALSGLGRPFSVCKGQVVRQEMGEVGRGGEETSSPWLEGAARRRHSGRSVEDTPTSGGL